MRPSLTALASIAAFALTSLPAVAAAPEAARVIGLNWVGFASAPADFTENGKVVIEETLHMSVDSADDISGTTESHFTLDQVRYDARYTVSGHYNGRDGISLRAHFQSGDALPHGLRWCSASGDLTIYRDTGRDGHYVLGGTLSDDCGGKSDIEFTDR